MLRAWQRGILRELFTLRPDGHRLKRVGLLGLPRKNGKSALASGLALQGLFDEPGAEVYSCAGDKEQARIVFAEARRSVEADDDLARELKVYRDAIEYQAMHSVYRVLSAEAYTKEGLNPSRVLFDEVHVQPDDELWNVMNLGSGTRTQPLVLGITTAGVRADSTGHDSVCFRLYQKGLRIQSGEEQDPSFFFRWYGAPDGSDYRDPGVWRAANPALGDFLYEEDFEVALRTVPEAEFRTKRLNQWVNSRDSWLPAGAFEARAIERTLLPKESVVLGFDGSFNNDCTALVACTLDGFLDVLGLWESDGSAGWEVPVEEVEAAVLAAAGRFQVRELAADPFRWAREIQRWGNLGIPVAEYPTTNPGRMVPACAKFRDAVASGLISHSGDPRLERHVGNAVVRVDRLGPRIVKEHRGSPRKIDLAVAAVAAYDRATFIADQPAPPKRTGAFLV